jgi:protoheme IX farnesyltransferase
MWYDADIDAVMTRTASRPVPSGRIQPHEALTFGLVLSVLSVMTLGVLVNWLSATLLAFTIFFYAVVYTMWLKRWTPQNIVIGGAAGAIPPVIGWAAVTGSVSLESIVLFLIIFLWTPPHFWALALFKSGDYKRAGIPMMPNVAGHASTRRQIFAYALVLAPVGVAPWLLGYTTPFYGVAAMLLGVGFVWYAWKVLGMADDDRAMKPAKALFAYSLLYLFAIFAAYLADSVVERALAMGGA